MATLTSQAIYYESGQSQQSFAEMTAVTDRTVYGLTNKPWSQVSGYAYTIAPYGLATGGTVIPAVSTTSDKIDVAALTAYMAGATGASATTGLLTVAATTDVSVTRGSSSNAYMINSVTVTSAGAIAVVSGTATTAFSETRGANGGPPFIPVGSIEIGQVRLTSTTAAAVASTEIYQTVGTHQERYDYPVWSEDPIRGQITFASSLPTVHTGSVAKKVYARVATPVFAEISRARNWVPAETSNSVNSESYYDGVIGSFSSSLSQASFECALNDGVTDNLLGKLGSNILVKFMPNKNGTPYMMTQGVLGCTRTFGVSASATATFSLSASQASVNFSS